MNAMPKIDLTPWIAERKAQSGKDLLLMTHIVLGYPDFDTSLALIRTMAEAGVDLIEMQIPFSEPIADGPIILHANQQALENGASVAECLAVAKTAAESFNIPFLLMSYYNILFKYGVRSFCDQIADIGITGTIVPDLPFEEADEYLQSMAENQLNPIFIYSPTSTVARLKKIDQYAKGFIYCVARRGVTGANTDFSANLFDYINRCRSATDLPLALGFGIKDADDLALLRHKVDIAVIGTQTIRAFEQGGIQQVKAYLTDLQSSN